MVTFTSAVAPDRRNHIATLGGLMKIVNGTVPMALEKLGYTKPEIEARMTRGFSAFRSS